MGRWFHFQCFMPLRPFAKSQFETKGSKAIDDFELTLSIFHSSRLFFFAQKDSSAFFFVARLWLHFCYSLRWLHGALKSSLNNFRINIQFSRYLISISMAWSSNSALEWGWSQALMVQTPQVGRACRARFSASPKNSFSPKRFFDIFCKSDCTQRWFLDLKATQAQEKRVNKAP